MYIIAYDVRNEKRNYKARKVAYSFAFGGQKSVVEAFLNKKELKEVALRLSRVINLEKDRVHIVRVKKFLYLGSAKEITFKKGDIII
ncbi:MAG: CRISPR-associated endonuclease Cas2 [Nautiliaceae bacterium]